MMGQTVEKAAPELLAEMARDIRNGFIAAHPGEIFRRRVIEERGLGPGMLAVEMGISRAMLHRVLSGQSSVTAEMAFRMAKLSGSRPETWLQLQNQFDLARVVRESGLLDEIERPRYEMPEKLKKTES